MAIIKPTDTPTVIGSHVHYCRPRSRQVMCLIVSVHLSTTQHSHAWTWTHLLHIFHSRPTDVTWHHDVILWRHMTSSRDVNWRHDVILWRHTTSWPWRQIIGQDNGTTPWDVITWRHMMSRSHGATSFAVMTSHPSLGLNIALLNGGKLIF